MKELRLADGYYAMVDDEDIDMLDKFPWQKHNSKYTFYATASIKIDGKFKKILMHRFIMNAPMGMDVDHLDHNGLNNQKSNLRVCTHKENMQNRIDHRREYLKSLCPYIIRNII